MSWFACPQHIDGTHRRLPGCTLHFNREYAYFNFPSTYNAKAKARQLNYMKPLVVYDAAVHDNNVIIVNVFDQVRRGTCPALTCLAAQPIRLIATPAGAAL